MLGVSFLVILFTFAGCVIVRIPVDHHQDRSHVFGLHNIKAQRLMNDGKAISYLAVVEDPRDFEIYKPSLDWGNSDCVQVETLSKIPRTGFWQRRVSGPQTAEVNVVPKNSEARERIMRLENLFSVHPCSKKEANRAWFKAPNSIFQTSTVVQLQAWADKNDLRGRNQTVVLVDTGIKSTHMQFGYSSQTPFVSIISNQQLVKTVSLHPRIDGIFIRKFWVGQFDMPDDYLLGCMMTDIDGHGTHCSGIIAGQAGSVGLASESKIIMINNAMLQSQPNTTCLTAGGLSGIAFYDIEDIITAGYDLSVISNSWGSSSVSTSIYTAENSAHDQIIYENQQLLFLFAAGNNGKQSFSAQARAHNVFSIGSSRDTFVMSSFSASGPDIPRNGFMTTHVATNGQFVLSADAFHDRSHILKSGTSMATPLAGGIAVLLKEWLIRKGYSNPTGRLLRAILVHCAVPLNGADADAQGFGFLQPALITDHGWFQAFDFLLNSTNTNSSVITYVAKTNEVFRISSSFYAPPGIFLENVVSLYCLRNGVVEFTRADALNTVSRMTIHLIKGDTISCRVDLVRATDSNGFYVSIAVGSWPTYIIYTKEDVIGSGSSLALFSIADADLMRNESRGIPLISPASFLREWFRQLANIDPLWYIFSICLGVGLGAVIYYSIVSIIHIREAARDRYSKFA